MSLKRILGTMLATRMAGRGRRRGGLGTGAMLGGLGYRRRGMGGKLGMAALGYMAYQAYKDHQTRSGKSGGSLGSMIRDAADSLTGGGTTSGARAAEAELAEDERAADSFSEDTALLLIRAMVTAAYSDGALSEEERGRIMGEIETAGGGAEDRRTMEREIANPRPLDELLSQVHDQETAQEFYLASRVALGETDQDRAYLSELRRKLKLSEQDVAEAEEMAS